MKSNRNIARPTWESEMEQAVLDLFPTLKKLRDLGRTRYGFSRYGHTLCLVRGLAACLKNDYIRFIRSNMSHRPTNLTQLQFADLSRRISEIYAVDPLFALAIIVTHDYGILAVPDARHFKMSGKVSGPDLVSLGLSPEKVKLAQLINAHHAYIGSLMLGENSLVTADFLARSSCKLGFQDKFFKSLWMLTVLDINASGVGYLSRDKYSRICPFHKYQAFISLKKNWAELRMSLLRPDLTPEGISPRYFNLSFNYIFNVIRESKRGKYVLSEADCKTLFSAFVELDRMECGRGYDVICFQTDVPGTAVRIKERLVRLMGAKAVTKKCFLGWKYRMKDGYLEILNGNTGTVKK